MADQSKKIDFTKPYGTITGHGRARFVQYEVLFDVDGNAVETQNTEPESAPKAAPIPRKAVK